MPNPTLIAATKNNAAITTGTSVTVSSTGNVTAGNLMVVVMEIGGATLISGVTPPAGWSTLLATTSTASVSPLIVAAVFYKQNTSTAAFSGSFSWTTAAINGEWLFMEWSGAGASLVDGAVATSVNATSTTPTSPTKTPSAGLVNDTLVCCLCAGIIGSTTVAVPAGMASILTVAGGATTELFGCASLVLTAATATGTKQWTLGTTQTSFGISFLIQQGPIWPFESVSSEPVQTPPSWPPKRVGAMIATGLALVHQPAGQLPPYVGVGGQIQPPQPPILRLGRVAVTKGRSEFGFYQPWRNAGWEIQPPQPPHQTPEKRFAAVAPKEDGIEATRINWHNAGWEVQPPQPPQQRLGRVAVTKGRSEFGFYQPWRNYGWDVQPPQPPHPRPEKWASAAPWISIDATYQLFHPSGWEVQPPQPPHPRPERFAAIAPKEDGIEWTKINWFNLGWEIQPPQPPQLRLGRVAVTKGKSEFGIYQPWKNAGWEIQPPQPPHQRPERSAAWQIGDFGIEAPFIPPVFTPPVGWEPSPFYPPHPRPERFASIAPRSDGTEAPFNYWRNAGWEIQSWQSPHPRPEKAAAGLIGDTGIQANFVPPVVPVWGYEAPQLQPPHPAPERHYGSLALGDSGTQAGQVLWFNVGWEFMPSQPPHPRPERTASWMIGDAGIYAQFITPIPPPPPPRVSTGYNILPTPLFYETVTSLVGVPAPSSVLPDTRAYLNQSVTLLLKLGAIFPVYPVALHFTKPDGTAYSTASFYEATIQSQVYIVYTTAIGELNQTGWWLVDIISAGDIVGTNNYEFFVFGGAP